MPAREQKSSWLSVEQLLSAVVGANGRSGQLRKQQSDYEQLFHIADHTVHSSNECSNYSVTVR